jgi:hypothetical protein
MSEKEFDLSGLNCMIALPSHDGKAYLDCVAGIMSSVDRLDKLGVPIDFAYLSGNALVQHARNVLVHKFMSNDKYNKLIFIDSDIGFRAEDMIRLLAYSSMEDMVAGLYPIKQESKAIRAVYYYTDEGPVQNHVGLVKMMAMPLGFSVIDKSVFRALEPISEKYDYEGEMITEYFIAHVKDGRLWGEDIDFCKRWEAIGGSMWCDPQIKLNHDGNYSYVADVDKFFWGVNNG